MGSSGQASAEVVKHVRGDPKYLKGPPFHLNQSERGLARESGAARTTRYVDRNRELRSRCSKSFCFSPPIRPNGKPCLNDLLTKGLQGGIRLHVLGHECSLCVERRPGCSAK